MLSASIIGTFLVMASLVGSARAFFIGHSRRSHLSSTIMMAVGASKKGKLLVLGGTGRICIMTRRPSPYCARHTY
jgi:hypothetical protein